MKRYKNYFERLIEKIQLGKASESEVIETVSEMVNESSTNQSYFTSEKGTFDEEELEYLKKRKVSIEAASKYPNRVHTHHIPDMIAVNCTPEYVMSFYRAGLWWTDEDIKLLSTYQIPCQMADELRNMGLRDWGMLQVYKIKKETHDFTVNLESLIQTEKRGDAGSNGLSVDGKDYYTHRFSYFAIGCFTILGITPEIAQSYSTRFRFADIIALHNAGITPEKTKAYAEQYTGFDIVAFTINNITNKQAYKYTKKFRSLSGKNIVALMRMNYKLDALNSYPKRFSGNERAELIFSGCLPEESAKYHERLNGHEISILHRLGIKPDMTKFEVPEFKKLLAEVEKIADLQNNINDYQFIATGKDSILILNSNEKTTWKFSHSIRNEYDLFRKIRHFTQNNPNFLSTLKGGLKNNCCLQLQYIAGKSLEQVLVENGTIDNDVMQYGKDILEGLLELRSTGIYHHRDIRPANILIEEQTNKAKIIDLGIATTNPDAFPKNNRRYGGPNDLVSLGQVMYKMATGEHIFAESKSMEKTIYARKIKDARDEIYKDPTGQKLEPYLQKVDHKVHDKNLATIIKACLTAGKDEHEKIMRLFKNGC